MKFTADIKSRDLKCGFQHEVEAESIESAMADCVKNLLLGYVESGSIGRHKETTITIWSEGGTVLGSWLVDIARPIEVPCGECGGEGGVDSGGMTPEGKGIDVPCPSCYSLQLKAPPAGAEVI